MCLLIVLLLILLFISSRVLIGQLDRRAALLIRKLLAEGSVCNPEVGGRDNRLRFAGLELETPAISVKIECRYQSL